MDDPTVLEASRVLAQRLMAQNLPAPNAQGQNLPAPNAAADQRLTTAFRLILCRKPSQKERTVLTGYYNDQLQAFRQKKLNAAKTLDIGEYPQNNRLDRYATAALMKTIELMYNLEETITRT